MAQWTRAYIDSLPDSSFACIEPGGKKDASGRTVPRALRHFPLRDKNGKLDADHVRDAASRAPQSPFGKGAAAKIDAAEKALKIGKYAEAKSAATMTVLPEGSAPDWIELIPAGQFGGRDGRGPYHLDDPEAVIKATQELKMSAGIPVDYDHATDFAAPHGQPAPAAGWITELQVRDGALMGKIEWTEAGAQAVAAREYRYISPVFQYDKKGNVVRLLRAGLTNNPNLYLEAISARATMADDDADMSAGEFKNRMAEVHGLDADASHEDILAAARGRKSAHEKHHKSIDEARACEDAGGPLDPDHDGDVDNPDDADAMVARMIASGKVVSHETHAALVTEVNKLKADRARERAERMAEDAIRNGRIIPAQREWAIAYAARDEKGFGEFVGRQPRIDLSSDGKLSGALPGSSQAEGLTARELAMCNELRVTPQAFAARKAAGALHIDPLAPKTAAA